ncbi:hypothetical protein BSKO_01250 [Bryopsis sp. KO-2023]|nr:hypothetical protein BSKO_01250 [Bryopsis sp. KO-2023]
MTTSNGVAKKLEGEAPESADYAKYFCTYAFLYHQKDMLEDHKRTGAYFNAVLQNKHMFEDRVVLDVGAGSGILAIFAAMAGAKMVYAVEATSMAEMARRLVKSNKFEDKIQVIQGTIETVDLPEKVDIIISEWMGYFLLRESMLDSVLHARDRWLKPGGAMYPSHAKMFLAPIRSQLSTQRHVDLQSAVDGWTYFGQDMQKLYGVSMDVLTPDFCKEQQDYYASTAQWTEIHPQQLLAPAACFKEYDLLEVSIEEVQKPVVSNFIINMYGGPIEAFAGYFDVSFKGSPQNPTTHRVELSTAPDPTGATHWGQLSFFLYPPIECKQGDKLLCSIDISRKKENHRLMSVNLKAKVEPVPPCGTAGDERDFEFSVE